MLLERPELLRREHTDEKRVYAISDAVLHGIQRRWKAGSPLVDLLLVSQLARA